MQKILSSKPNSQTLRRSADCNITVLHSVIYIMGGQIRMKLYLGNMVTTVTTLMIVSLVGFVGYSISNRSNINFWGRRSLFILAYSLVICCFAAARDGLDKTIQYTIDGSCNPGIFSLVSVPNIVGCVGAAIIIIAAIATPIAKSQHMREIWFYVMSGGVMLKIVVMEIARIIQMF